MNDLDKRISDALDNGYDFLIFVYAPSMIINGVVKPGTGKETDETKGMYVFPRSVVKTAVDEETGTVFDPRNIGSMKHAIKADTKSTGALII